MRAPRGTAWVGVAVEPGAVTGAVLGSPAPAERIELGGGAGEWASALQRLAERLERAHARSLKDARAVVALLPPLAELRILDLPPLRQGELEAVVRRDAARHFPGGEGRWVVGVGRAGGARTGVVAAAAPLEVVEGLRAAVATVGWRLEKLVPAPAAWLGALGAGRGQVALVVAVHGETAHVLRMEGGGPSAYRRLPRALAADLGEAGGVGRGPAVAFGDPSDVRSTVEALTSGGWTVSALVETHLGAAEAAARHARSARIALVPPSLSAEKAATSRRAAARRLALAAGLVGVAGLVHAWGLGRELDTVRSARAAIRTEVAPLIAAQDSLDRLVERTRAIDEITDRSPRWTRALYDMAALLPRDAYLTSLAASGDTVELEAAAARAGESLERLREARSLADVTLLGPVDRELEEGETVTERFRIRAHLAPWGEHPAESDSATDAPGAGGAP